MKDYIIVYADSTRARVTESNITQAILMNDSPKEIVACFEIETVDLWRDSV